MIKIVILSSVAVLAVFAGYDVPVVASAPAQTGYGAPAYNQAAYAPSYGQGYPLFGGFNRYYYNRHRHSHSSSSESNEHRRNRCQPPFDLCKSSEGCNFFRLPGYTKGDKTVKIVCLDTSSSLVSGKNTPIATTNATGTVEVVAKCGRNGKWIANGVKFTEAKCIADENTLRGIAPFNTINATNTVNATNTINATNTVDAANTTAATNTTAPQ